MGKFVIKRRSNGEYQFNLVAGNGEVILTSEGYSTKSSCVNGIESVMANASQDGRYERRESANGRYYFNLLAANNRVIGASELYSTVAGRDAGVEAVKRNASTAQIEDYA